MGTAIKVKCQSCRRKWIHYSGTGAIFTHYYCDRCGSQKTVNNHEYDECNEPGGGCGGCDCGGSYKIDSPVICPKCKSKDVAEYVNKKGCIEVITWD